MPRQLELLAPARTADIAIAAIDHGADAVYIGAAHHGARHAAGNSLDDIARVVDYCHRYDARTYVTLNTLIYDNELESVRRLVDDLYHIGVDALIVQDMALLNMPLPPIALHASTQCDIRTPERARFLQEAGCSQLVLARELTLDEIRAIRAATTVPLEAFVHGALCVSYSGNCQASCVATGRSANRGECAQMCRLPYDLVDGNGRSVVAARHLLSLKDMNRIAMLESMIDAGIDSFKIEGRLKDLDYVKNTVSAYSDRLDAIIAARGDASLTRSSIGRVERTFAPDLNSTFNRGYTDYFLSRRHPERSMASFDTPKSAGQPVGTVTALRDRTITVKTDVELANGDGLTYFDHWGTLRGFRVNRFDRGRIETLTRPEGLAPGMTLYRNHDIRRETIMARPDTARRAIDIDMTLRLVDSSRLSLDITIPHTRPVTLCLLLTEKCPVARSPQREPRLKTLSKLGDTPYRLASLDDRVAPDIFIPLSALTTLRREAIALLDSTRRATYPREYRRPVADVPALGRSTTDYTDNIANREAADFYRRAGVTDIAPAIELKRPTASTRVMLTRYCLRRELGYCLKTPQGKRLPEPLTLHNATYGNLHLRFDCSRCEMSVRT